jgi:hypothetical protein
MKSKPVTLNLILIDLMFTLQCKKGVNDRPSCQNQDEWAEKQQGTADPKSNLPCPVNFTTTN